MWGKQLQYQLGLMYLDVVILFTCCFAVMATYFFVYSDKEVGKKTPPNTVCPAGTRALVTHSLICDYKI